MNLADIYSYIDSKKRAVGGLLSDPAGTLDKYVSQLREDHKAQTNLMANAYPMAGDKTVLNSPHQLDQFRQQLADEGANMALGAATVWHGQNPKNDMSADYLKNLVSSQRYLDRDIVAKKIKSGDYSVRVTPEFEIDGEKVRAITDGHHALEASIRSGNTPKFIQDSTSKNDRIQLLKDGNVDAYLEAAYHDSPWYNFSTKRDLF